MIVGGDEPLVIGKRAVRFCNDQHGVTHRDVPMLVLRAATADEFAQQCRDYCIAQEHIDRALKFMIYFYEVSVD